jgi:hypothetical protein
MKQYPTIPKQLKKCNATKFWVFDKLDGSNIRAEWSKKRGFYKFGSRKRLLGTDQGILARAEELIRFYEERFTMRFGEFKIDRAICFFEFWGPSSFAGFHKKDDILHRVSLIDID